MAIEVVFRGPMARAVVGGEMIAAAYKKPSGAWTLEGREVKPRQVRMELRALVIERLRRRVQEASEQLLDRRGNMQRAKRLFEAAKEADGRARYLLASAEAE